MAPRPDRRRVQACRCRVQSPSSGLPHGQHQQDGGSRTDQGNQDKGRTPAERAGHPSAETGAQEYAEGAVDGEQSDHRGSPLRRVVVCEDGQGRGRASGLPHANPETGRRQLPEAAGEPAGPCGQAPQQAGGPDNADAVCPVGQHGGGDANESIEEREA